MTSLTIYRVKVIGKGRFMGLYSHQKVMMRFSLSRLRSAYLADVGTGKTRPAILTFYMRKLKGRAKKCLVTVPSTIMYNWIDELEKCNTGLKAVVIYAKGSKAKQKREEILAQEADIYIINHDYLSKLKYPLAAKNFDFIIVDELTKFKHHNTQRSKALRFITKDIRYRLGLTGSPITQSPMDAFGEMLVIDPTLYGDNFFAFRNHYFYNATARAPFPTWVPVKNRLVKLANKLAEVCLRLEKKDCLDLPPMVVETREIEMPSKMSSDYDQMVKHLVLELKEYGVATAEVVLKKLIRLAQITSGFVKSEEGEEVDLGYSPKINELKDLVENELAGKKVIVWARFVRTIEQLAEQFKDLKPAVVWGGDINMEHRHEEIRRFQQDPDCKMFIGQISLGFGFNLTAADTMVYVEHNFSVEDRHQTKGRFDRIGQTAEKTTVIDLVMKNSIDTYMLRSVKENQSVADFIYDVLRMKRKEE